MSKTIKAKFKCAVVHDFGNQKKVDFTVVTSGSEENKSFSKWTPSGDFSLTVTDETAAFDYFTPGEEYIIDINKAN